MEKCWLCPRSYPSRTELIAHLVSRDHRRQSVNCPWCGEDKTFTRVSDLAIHCGKRHFVETNTLHKSFLTARNCFYFAIYPNDYAKIHKPENWGSQNAAEARRLVMKMFDGSKENHVKRDNWRSGWRAAVKRNERGKENDDTMEKYPKDKTKWKHRMKHENVKEANSQNPKQDEDEKSEPRVSTERNANVKKSTIKKDNKESDKKIEIKMYEPLDLTMKVNDRTSKRKATDTEEISKAKVVKVNMEDKREYEKETIEKEISNEKPELPINKSAEIQRGDVKETECSSVKRGDIKSLEVKDKESEVGMGEDCDKLSDNESNSSVLSLEKDASEIFSATKLIIDEMEKEDKGELNIVKEILKDSSPENTIKPQKRDVEMKKRNGLIRRVIVNESKVKVTEYDSEKPSMDIQNSQDTTEYDPESPFVKAACSDINRDNYEDVDLVQDRGVTATQDQTHPEEQNYRQKAVDILKTGVMPLVPPGRRDWKGEENFHIHLYGCNFTWPPVGWQKMTPDRRLMAWEHTAFQLEYLQEGVINPTMSRSFLLDKYNFLALPGSGKVKKEENEKGAAKARYYAYQMLREVAKGKEPTEAERCQMDALGSIIKQGELQKQLKALKTPLRLV